MIAHNFRFFVSLLKMKIIKIILFFLILIFIWNDFKKIAIKYVNQPQATYDSSNLNNNILKKFINYTIKQ